MVKELAQQLLGQLLDLLDVTVTQLLVLLLIGGAVVVAMYMKLDDFFAERRARIARALTTEREEPVQGSVTYFVLNLPEEVDELVVTVTGNARLLLTPVHPMWWGGRYKADGEVRVSRPTSGRWWLTVRAGRLRGTSVKASWQTAPVPSQP